MLVSLVVIFTGSDAFAIGAPVIIVLVGLAVYLLASGKVAS
jgi:hypothetical protein